MSGLVEALDGELTITRDTLGLIEDELAHTEAAVETLKNDLTVMEARENALLTMLTTAKALPVRGEASGEAPVVAADPPAAATTAAPPKRKPKAAGKPRSEKGRARPDKSKGTNPPGPPPGGKPDIGARIVDALTQATEPMTSKQLQHATGGAQANVDKHLRKLGDAGTVMKIDSGTRNVPNTFKLAQAAQATRAADTRRRELPTVPDNDDDFPPRPGIHATAGGARYTDDQEKIKASIYRILAKGPKDPGAIAASLCKNRREVEHIIAAEINAGRIARTTGAEEMAYPDCVKALVNQADLDALAAVA